jgi:hypothetical protein
MRSFLITLFCLCVIFVVYVWRPGTRQNAYSAPSTARATITVTPAGHPTPETPASGDPLRVNFAIGSYGATLLGATSTKYLLWAAQGQVFTATLAANSTALASLYGPDGVAIYEQLAAGNTASATLPISGDFMLEIRSSGTFTAGVEIR